MACFRLSSNTEKSLSLRAASGSNHLAETSPMDHSGGKVCKGEALMYASEVERISDRVRILEEEAEVMKQDFIESLEERKKLMNEISHQFQVIYHYSRFGKQVGGDESTDGFLLVNPPKNGREGAGLSQVLNQQSNPSLVIRDLKATIGASEESDDTYEFPK